MARGPSMESKEVHRWGPRRSINGVDGGPSMGSKEVHGPKKNLGTLPCLLAQLIQLHVEGILERASLRQGRDRL